MVKTIKIGDKSYDMKSSAFTMFAYKDKLGRNLLTDINSINKKYNEIQKKQQNEQEEAWMDEITPLIENTLKLAHIMICEQNSGFMCYEDWLKELDYLMDNTEWILNVLELGMTPFQGRIQNSQ